jgi:DnaD/phage-associated family protein
VSFPGFPAGKTRLTPIPARFFADLLPEIDHLGELKVILYAFWSLDRQEEKVRYLTRADFLEDERFIAGLAPYELDDCLERAAQRGVLLRALPRNGSPSDALYFLNSPRGRAALQAVESGKWQPERRAQPAATLEAERPNIFRLYEQNIGPLTPLIAETLQDAEKTYPADWIEEAFKMAVERNKRRWNYIQAILKSWQEEGRDQSDRRDTAQNRRKYVEGKFSEFIEH